MASNKLSEAEVVAARMFFDVSMQAAFGLEDPNSRFAQVFAHKDAMGPRVATLAEVPARTYESTVDNTHLVFQVRPDNSPVLSRVLMQGGLRKSLIRFLENAMHEADYFTLQSLGSAEALEDLTEHHTDIGNFTYRLVIDEDLKKTHDVAVMFAWGLKSERGTMMELSAWPIDKASDL